MDITNKFYIVELKYDLLKVVVSLEQDATYQIRQAVTDLKEIVLRLDSLDMEANRTNNLC